MKKQIGLRLILCFILIILFGVFFITVFSYNQNSNLRKSNEAILHNAKVLYRSEKVLSVLTDIETRTRGYVITGDSVFLQPYFLSKDSISYELTELAKLTDKNENQVPLVKRLKLLAAGRLDICKELQQVRNQPDYSLAAVKPLLNRGKDIMDRIRDAVTKIQAEEKDAVIVREKSNKENQAAAENSFFILFGGIVFLFLASIFAAGYSSRLRSTESSTLVNTDSSFIFFSKRMDDIIKGISDPFFALNKKYEFIFHNNAFQDTLASSKGTVTGKNIFTLFPEYRNEMTGKSIEDAMASGKTTTYEQYDFFYDKWFDVTVYPTAEGVSAYMKDATKRKDYERELKAAEELLEITNRVALIGGWEVNLQTVKVTWTNVTKLIHETPEDYEPTLITGIAFYKEGKDRETITALVDAAIENNEEWDAELQIVTHNGNEKWIRAKGKPIFEDGECVRLVGTFQDIDAQKKILNSLQKNEALFRSAFENSPDGMSLVDAKSGDIKVNRSFTKITGYTAEEFKEIGFEGFTHPDDRAKDKEIYAEIINGEKSNWHYEKRYLHKDGSIIYGEASGSAVKDDYGNIISFVAQLKDLTKLKEKD